MSRTFTRRGLLKAVGMGVASACLAACAPKVVEVEKEKLVEKEVTKVVKETVVSQPPASDVVKLVVMWRTNPVQQPMVDTINTAFVKNHPDVFVEQVVAPWAEFEPKLMSMYAAGIAPDIFGLGGTNVYVERFLRGVTLSLDEFAAQDTAFIEDLWPICTKSYTINGHLCAIPMYAIPAGVYVNATRFDEAGVPYPPHDWSEEWTWDTAMQAAKQLTRDTNGDGKIDTYGFQAGHSSPWYYTRLWGEDLISEEDYARGFVSQWQTDDKNVYDALVAGLQARADTVYIHGVSPTPATATAMGQMGPMLRTGAIAMEFTAGWSIDGVLPDEFAFRCAREPSGAKGATAGATWASSLQINSQSAHPEMAWQWIKFFCTDPEMVAYRAPLMGQTPSIRSALEPFIDSFVKNKPQVKMTRDELVTFFKGAAEQAERSCPCQILAGWAAARDTFNAELDAAWLGERPVKEVVDGMIPKVNAIYEENAKQLELL